MDKTGWFSSWFWPILGFGLLTLVVIIYYLYRMKVSELFYYLEDKYTEKYKELGYPKLSGYNSLTNIIMTWETLKILSQEDYLQDLNLLRIANTIRWLLALHMAMLIIGLVLIVSWRLLILKG